MLFHILHHYLILLRKLGTGLVSILAVIVAAHVPKPLPLEFHIPRKSSSVPSNV